MAATLRASTARKTDDIRDNGVVFHASQEHLDAFCVRDLIGHISPFRNEESIISDRSVARPKTMLMTGTYGRLLQLEPLSDDHPTWDRIASLLDKIPRIEADIIQLYCHTGHSQQQIAALFDRASKSTICYLIRRATKRIRFLLALPVVSPAQLADAIGTLAPDDVQLCLAMVETTCVEDARRRFRGLSAFCLMRRYDAVIARLRAASERAPKRYGDALKTLVMVRDNPRILQEYRQPALRAKKKKRAA